MKLECEGLLFLIQPKMYVMFSTEIQKEVIQKGDLREWLKTIDIRKLENPKDLVHFALHSFWGNVHDILELYRDKKNLYSCKHMMKTREAIRQRKQARVMVDLTRKTNIDWEKEVGLCGMLKKDAVRQNELCNNHCFSCAYIVE